MFSKRAYGHYCFWDIAWRGLTQRQRHSAVTVWHCVKSGLESLYVDSRVSGWLAASSCRVDIVTVLPAMTPPPPNPLVGQAACAH